MCLKPRSSSIRSPLLFLLTFLSLAPAAAQVTPRNYAVELTANISSSPPEIRLNWKGDGYATGYIISRKFLQDQNWTEIGRVGGGDNSFLDRNVTSGTIYEYQVIKETSVQSRGYGYITSGIEIPATDHRGTVLLLVESSVEPALGVELKRLEFDLMGDGWTVLRRSVSRNENVRIVKDMIRAEYNSHPDLKSLFLFGHIPVPYSGDITPDEHPNHLGAWPADVYYADLDGTWTDDSVTSTGAERSRNWNKPGDGKFDQSDIPSRVELEVGRVDLSNMTCFANKVPSLSETDLLRRYLDKDHNYRHARFQVQNRALIMDRIGLTQPDPLIAMAWRNFAPAVGENLDYSTAQDFIARTTAGSYLWSALSGGGGYTHSDVVGRADEFAVNTVQVVFSMFCGSYYGDWDVESNFLRAALGTAGFTLASIYSAQPQWLCHRMQLGGTLGSATQLTQNNRPGGTYPPPNRGAGQVHIALMGDPTLRMHPIAPPANLRGTTLGSRMELTWEPSTAPELKGYMLLSRPGPGSPFRQLSTDLLQSTALSVEHQSGQQYMVKAVVLTRTPSGAYWNTSQGIAWPLAGMQETGNPPLPPRVLHVAAASPNSIQLKWLIGSATQDGFVIERATPGAPQFKEIGRTGPSTIEFLDNSLPLTGFYRYRVRAFNNAGLSEFSNETGAFNESAFVEPLGIDRTTQGNWKGRYGKEGFHIVGTLPQLPSFLSLIGSNLTRFNSPVPEGNEPLLLPDSNNRIAHGWVNSHPFAFDISFTDEKTHRFSFYAWDYGNFGYQFDIEIIDFITRQVIHRQTIDNFKDGVHISYALRNRAIVRIVPEVSDFVGIYGLFIDEAKIAPPLITPSGGSFPGKTQVSLSTVTPGTAIHYTMDGSSPLQSSPLYTGPFWIFADARIQARAFKRGFDPSEVSVAELRNTVRNQVGFLRLDESTKGNWVGSYGTVGYWLPRQNQVLPPTVELRTEKAEDWVWMESTEEDRALYSDSSRVNRRASGWYSEDTFNLHVGVFDTKSLALGLHFLDWDNLGREQKVEILDTSGNVVDEFLVTHFSGGKYLVLNIQGQATIRISRLQGSNAVLNGIFLDPSPVQLGPPNPLLVNSRLIDNHFSISISAEPGHQVCLDRSNDLRAWVCLQTNTVTQSAMELNDNSIDGISKGYYRVHIVP